MCSAAIRKSKRQAGGAGISPLILEVSGPCTPRQYVAKKARKRLGAIRRIAAHMLDETVKMMACNARPL